MMQNKRIQGFTLLELLIALAIIGILASFAYPSYQDFLYKGRRSDAIAALLTVQLAEEKWRTSHGSYSDDFSALKVSDTSQEGYYTLEISAADAVGYTIKASAVKKGPQAGDSECSEIILTRSADGESRTPAVCWSK